MYTIGPINPVIVIHDVPAVVLSIRTNNTCLVRITHLIWRKLNACIWDRRVFVSGYNHLSAKRKDSSTKYAMHSVDRAHRSSRRFELSEGLPISLWIQPQATAVANFSLGGDLRRGGWFGGTWSNRSEGWFSSARCFAFFLPFFCLFFCTWVTKVYSLYVSSSFFYNPRNIVLNSVSLIKTRTNHATTRLFWVMFIGVRGVINSAPPTPPESPWKHSNQSFTY